MQWGWATSSTNICYVPCPSIQIEYEHRRYNYKLQQVSRGLTYTTGQCHRLKTPNFKYKNSTQTNGGMKTSTFKVCDLVSGQQP